MDIEVLKKLLKTHMTGHRLVINRALEAKRYYDVQNDILLAPPKVQSIEEAQARGERFDPARQADNRIAYSFYPLLLDQKAAYMFTAPPIFDVKDDTLNDLIGKALGDSYEKNVKDLCVEASNGGIAWIHYWKGDTGFEWSVIPTEEVIPLYDRKNNTKLIGVFRTYIDTDDNGDYMQVYEYWNDTICEMYQSPLGAIDSAELQLTPYMRFSYLDIDGVEGQTNTVVHGMGDVPFIGFANNSKRTNDLSRIKKLIDAYDATYSGFLNDLEDVQEVIYVLTNYGGDDLGEFLDGLKKYKTVQMDSSGPDDRSGISTLTIDIPVEARKELLEMTRKAIFDMGQGIDPQQQGLDGTSGEAMKFLYTLLELKAGMMETEFKLGFNHLIRAICRFYGRADVSITQTWTRTSVKNDSDLADMCQKSMGLVSTETILAHHPFVDDVQEEMARLDAQRAKADEMETMNGMLHDWQPQPSEEQQDENPQNEEE